MRRRLNAQLDALLGRGGEEEGRGEGDEVEEEDEDEMVPRIEEGIETVAVEPSVLRARAAAPELDPALGTTQTVSRADLDSWGDIEEATATTAVEEEEEEEDREMVRTKATEEADRLRRELLAQERHDVNGGDEEGDGEEMAVMAAVQDEAEKAQHAQTQARLWETVMETRIHMQPLIVAASRLPRPEAHAMFCSESADVAAACKDVASEARALVCDLAALDCELWNANEETCNIAGRAEHISTEDGEDSARLWKALQTRQKGFRRYTSEIIDKWHQRTLIGTAGANAGRKFKAVNLTLSQQIDQALEDKTRLVRRTRIRRSAIGRVLGDVTVATTPTTMTEDGELFDDADFYSELLRELIENSGKGNGGDGAAAELATLRAHKKRQMAAKPASKGRAIRYDVIAELVNFMAPVDAAPSTRTDWDTDQLFANIFGKQQQP